MKKVLFIILTLLSSSIFAQNLETPVSSGKNAYVIQNEAYILGFSDNHEMASWVFYKLTPKMFYGEADSELNWKADSRVKGFGISAKDIENVSIEAVQLFPKKHSKNDSKVLSSSLLTSNVIFMNRYLKNSIWDKIDKKAEEIASSKGAVFVISGPVYEKNHLKTKYLLNNRLEIPTHFFRILFYFENNKPCFKCYRLLNRIPSDYDRRCDLSEFEYNIYQLEADTGIDFFDRDIDANFRQEKMKFLETRVTNE